MVSYQIFPSDFPTTPRPALPTSADGPTPGSDATTILAGLAVKTGALATGEAQSSTFIASSGDGFDAEG
jgi:hypothetical protein